MFWSLGSILVLCNIRSERNDVEMWYWWYMASVEAFSMFIIAANVCLLLMTYISILCLHRVTVQFFTFQDWVVTHEKHRLSLAKKCIIKVLFNYFNAGMRGMKIMILPPTMYNYELIFFCLNCHARWVCLVFIICREYQHVLNVSSVSSCFSSTKKKNCDVARVIWNAFLFNCTWRHKPALCLSADIPSHVDRLIEHWNKRVEIQTVCDGMCAVLTYCEYVCVFVCVCVCVNRYTSMNIYICVCVCVCVNRHWCDCVCVCVCVCVWCGTTMAWWSEQRRGMQVSRLLVQPDPVEPWRIVQHCLTPSQSPAVGYCGLRN